MKDKTMELEIGKLVDLNSLLVEENVIEDKQPDNTMLIPKKICSGFEFNDYQTAIETIINMALSEYDEAYNRTHILELELNDIAHYMEKPNLPKRQLNKLAQEFATRRIERRKTKATVCYLKEFINTIKMDRYQFAFSQLYKNKRMLQYNDTGYKFRALDVEKELLGGEDNVL